MKGGEFSDMEGIARVKSRKFAVRIVRLYQFLCNVRKEFVLSKQLLRRGTAIGANLTEDACQHLPRRIRA